MFRGNGTFRWWLDSGPMQALQFDEERCCKQGMLEAMARIGLLEDNSRIAKLCATMLQYMNHQVTIYEHPRECLRALLSPSLVYESRDQEYRSALRGAITIVLLILDLHLP
jgi:CheY-like chemotaxis protein